MSSRSKLEEMRRKEEEAATKKVFAEFVESFSEEDASKPKAFVRGGVVNPAEDTKGGSGAKLYKPQPLFKTTIPPPAPILSASFLEAKAKAEEKAKRIMEEAKKSLRKRGSLGERPPKPGKGVRKPKSNLEQFKDELKQMQEARTERKQIRRQLQEQLGADRAALDRIAPALDTPYMSNTYDQDDPYTTNLFLSNLSQDVTEADIIDVFGRFGPLASVKVMYPRSDEDRLRGFLCGFVAYMTRVDADRAVIGLEGKGYLVKSDTMRISWAKGVNIPGTPVFVPPPMMELTMPPPRSDLPFNAQPRTEDVEAYMAEAGPLPPPGGPDPTKSTNPRERDLWDQMIRNAVVRVVIPTERQILGLMHRVIEFVVREGPRFEALLMSREANNPIYRFLFDNQTPAHVYYRWKLYSVLMGDSISKWRMEDFHMFDGGSVWRPPPIDFYGSGMPKELYHLGDFSKVEASRETSRQNTQSPSRSSRSRSSSSSSSDSSRSPSPSFEQRKNNAAAVAARLTACAPLSDRDRDNLEDKLRSLIPERWCIGEAMLFCLQHADSANEIVECLAESLEIPETPLHKKIARLYLVSDILSNCGNAKITNVSYFRKYFGDRMEKMFMDMRASYARIEARLKAEGFKQRVMAVFRCWEEHSLYNTDFLIKLQNLFLVPIQTEGLLLPESVESEEEEERRWVPRGDDIDGVPLDLGPPKALVDYDVDGMPLEDSEGSESGRSSTAPKELPPPPAPVKPPPGRGTGFKSSKWEEVDPEDVQKQAMTTSKWEALEGGPEEEEDVDGVPLPEEPQSTSALGGLAAYDNSPEDDSDVDGVPMEESQPIRPQPTASTGGTMKMDDRRRNQLREVEVKVMLFQDDLEMEKDPNLRDKVTAYRQELTAKLEEEWVREAENEEEGELKGESAHRSKSRKEERKERNGRSDHKKRKRDSPSPKRGERSRERESSSSKKSRKRSKSRSPKRPKHSRRSRSISPKHKKSKK